MKIYNMPTVRHYSSFLKKISTFGIPKFVVLVTIFRVFIWLLSLKNAGKKLIIHLQRFNDVVLPPFNYCIVDEVDSVLIDEALTPLIIANSVSYQHI